MNYRSISLLLLVVCSLFSQSQNVADLARQLEAAKELYGDKMAELEKVSNDRWKARQKAVLEKEQNQIQLEQQRSSVEQLYSDVARVREEKLSREELLSVEQSKAKDAQESWNGLLGVVEQKRSLTNRESGGIFPIGLEQRMAAVAAVDARFPGNRYPSEVLKGIVKTQADQLRDSREITTTKTTIVDEANNPREVNLLRIGHAYAVARTDSAAFYLSFFGEGASVPFKWLSIEDPVVGSLVGNAIAGVSQGTAVVVPVDMLQNDQSQELISGKKAPLLVRIKDFIIKGGFVMGPLILVALWAIVIALNRIVVYAIHHRRDYQFINEAVRLLEMGKISEAKLFSERGKGVLARVLNSCLKHTDQSRTAAEQSVKEMLLGEMPSLEKHLDTLAVIAGSAPLLGLLGTVTGMINMFEAITAFGTGDPKLLAGGISEALITTEVGLAIAIPVLLLHNWLRNRRNGIQAEMEIYAMRILNRIWPAE